MGDVTVVGVGADAYLLDRSNGQGYRLNATGARLWRLLEQGRPWAEAVDVLVAESEGVPAETVRRDADAFAAQLRGAGLLPS